MHLLPLLAACGFNPTCESPPLPELFACLAPEDANTDAIQVAGFIEAGVAGTVTHVGESVPTSGCVSVEQWLAGEAWVRPVWWIALVDKAGLEWTVATDIPLQAPELLEGQDVLVSWRWDEAIPDVQPEHFELLVTKDLAPVLYVADRATTAELQVPEGVAIDAGDTLLTCEDGCATQQWVDLVVTAGGTTAPLATGSTTKLGDIEYFHAGSLRVAGEDTCPTAWLGRSRLAWTAPVPPDGSTTP